MLAVNFSKKTSWYVARSGGLVAWVLCTASIVWGLMLSTRLVRRKGAPAWLLDMHRFLGTLSIVFTVVHVLGLYFDSFLKFSLADILIPLHMQKYRPGAVAWGVVAFYIAVAVQATSWGMRHMPRKVWHTIHLSSFLLFAFATIHSFQAGADKGNLLVQWLALTGVTIVLFLSFFRLLSPRKARKAERAAASKQSVAV